MEDKLEFLAPRPGGGCALGCSSVTGRCWSGSAWLYDDPTQAPDAARALASYQLQAGVPCGTWVSRDVLVVAADGGSLEWLRADADTTNISTATTAQSVTDNTSHDNDGNHSKHDRSKDDKHDVDVLINERIDEHRLSSFGMNVEHTATVNSLAVTCDGTQLITASDDYSVRIFECSGAQQQSVRSFAPAHGRAVTHVAAHPSSPTIFVTAGSDGAVLLWDVRQPRPASGLFRNLVCPTTALVWLSNSGGSGLGSLLLGQIDGHLLVLQTEASREITACGKILNRSITRLVAAPTQPNTIAVCGYHEAVKVVKVESQEIIECYSSAKHRDFVSDVMWLDDSTLLSCGWDKQVLRHDVAAERRCSEFHDNPQVLVTS